MHDLELSLPNTEGSELEFDFEEPREEGELSEADELEMAAELMSASSEAEVDEFLGKLIKRAARGVGKAVHAATGRSLGGMLKGLARSALPVVSKAVGGMVGGPFGAMLTGAATDAATKAFGLELEGMSAEDSEFEVTRRFVRFANSAARRAVNAGPRQHPKAAIIAAASRYAPGLLRAGGGGYQHQHHHHHHGCSCPTAAAAQPEPVDTAAEPLPGEFEQEFEFETAAAPRAMSGRWVRKGQRIVLLGI